VPEGWSDAVLTASVLGRAGGSCRCPGRAGGVARYPPAVDIGSWADWVNAGGTYLAVAGAVCRRSPQVNGFG